MIVSWKDEEGVTYFGDDKSKAYKQHLENKPAEKSEKPALAKAVVVTPDVEEAKRK
ncbi:hypothetical protein [Micromonospora sp. NPDC048169]|uniref:hypothetical protein n=1 Tax=Micromonospora sp. NPDC048169 TaxID=3154711 RepID=UPI0033D52F57